MLQRNTIAATDTGEPATEATAVSDKRKSPRMRALLGARARYDQRRVTLDCVVRNISDGGAMLVVPTTVPLPNAFELEIAQRRQSYAATIRWRRGEKIGVAFDAAVPADVVAADLASRLRLAERTNEQLRNRVSLMSESG
jgi:hypothetical protein